MAKESERRELEKYWANAQEEEQIILDSQSPLNSVRRAYFTSTSNGRGKKRRSPREVELLGYGNKYRAIRNDWCRDLDVTAQEIYGDSLEIGVDPVQKLLEELRKRT